MVSSRQLVWPLSVWQLTVTCLIFASRKPNSDRHRSRMPFFLGSTLGNLVIVVPGGGASTSSLPSVFFSSALGVSAFFLASALGVSAFLASALGASAFFLASALGASAFLASALGASAFFLASALGRRPSWPRPWAYRPSRSCDPSSFLASSWPRHSEPRRLSCRRRRCWLFLLRAEAGHGEVEIELTDEASRQSGRPFESDAVDFIEGDLGFGRLARRARLPGAAPPWGPAMAAGVPPGSTIDRGASLRRRGRP